MNCREVQKFLDAYVDGELDLVHNLEIERHLQDCLACQTAYQNHLTLTKSLKSGSLYYELPANLTKRIHTSLRKATPRQLIPNSDILFRRGLLVGSSIAAVIVLLAVGGLVFLLSFASNETDRVNQEVLDSHIRSLMVNHLADVVSTDQHTVKPWFDGKLDFSPVVEDFADKGYPLTGGRLDYLDNQPAAALVYQHGKHIINVFIWRNNNPSLKADLQVTTLQGYHLFHWIERGSNYWVVSDLSETDLSTFIKLIKPVIS